MSGKGACAGPVCEAAGVAEPAVRVWPVRYRSNTGAGRRAYIVLPRDVRPGHVPGPLPLVVSPHGRGVKPLDNVKLWGNLPALGRFALLVPEGQGRKLVLYSWGWRGQIRDLARAREIAVETLPWLKIDRQRFFAVGGSMGGQETLLLVAKFGKRLAGAAAFDSATDLAKRFRDFHVLSNGASLRRLSTIEVGGTPQQNPNGYKLRSPIHYAKQIAASGCKLQMWWSTADRIVVDQAHQSQVMFDRIVAAHPTAPLDKVVGTWRHSAEMRANTQLPRAIEWLGLLDV
jgi:dipeptidyl aminopeptidase/acylaminoacyl peptidase